MTAKDFNIARYHLPFEDPEILQGSYFRFGLWRLGFPSTFSIGSLT